MTMKYQAVVLELLRSANSGRLPPATSSTSG